MTVLKQAMTDSSHIVLHSQFIIIFLLLSRRYRYCVDDTLSLNKVTEILNPVQEGEGRSRLKYYHALQKLI